METSLVFEVGLESPTPVFVFPEIDIPFASPSVALGTTTGDMFNQKKGSYPLGVSFAGDSKYAASLSNATFKVG